MKWKHSDYKIVIFTDINTDEGIFNIIELYKLEFMRVFLWKNLEEC